MFSRGFASITNRFKASDNAKIDPALAIWSWEIPVYLFLGGMTAGVMILAALAGAAAAQMMPLAKEGL